jgi:hypothetical protein
METAIILEGFKNSVAMHNLKYTKIIGDGDSSVYKKITESMPYGPHCFIEKIECRNQIMRNYCNKIKEIGKMPSIFKLEISCVTIFTGACPEGAPVSPVQVSSQQKLHCGR